MDITKWTPFGDLANEMTSIQNRLARIFRELPVGGEAEATSARWLPDVDILEQDNDLVIRADLPGMKLEDIAVEQSGNRLIIRGERKHEEKVEKEGYYRSERSYGQFHRSFELPWEVKKDVVRATFENGVLEVRIPKTEAVKAKKILIESKNGPKATPAK